MLLADWELPLICVIVVNNKCYIGTSEIYFATFSIEWFCTGKQTIACGVEQKKRMQWPRMHASTWINFLMYRPVWFVSIEISKHMHSTTLDQNLVPRLTHATLFARVEHFNQIQDIRLYISLSFNLYNGSASRVGWFFFFTFPSLLVRTAVSSLFGSFLKKKIRPPSFVDIYETMCSACQW
jgi:hypothetical protein